MSTQNINLYTKTNIEALKTIIQDISHRYPEKSSNNRAKTTKIVASYVLDPIDQTETSLKSKKTNLDKSKLKEIIPNPDQENLKKSMFMLLELSNEKDSKINKKPIIETNISQDKEDNEDEGYETSVENLDEDSKDEEYFTAQEELPDGTEEKHIVNAIAKPMIENNENTKKTDIENTSEQTIYKDKNTITESNINNIESIETIDNKIQDPEEWQSLLSNNINQKENTDELEPFIKDEYTDSAYEGSEYDSDENSDTDEYLDEQFKNKVKNKTKFTKRNIKSSKTSAIRPFNGSNISSKNNNSHELIIRRNLNKLAKEFKEKGYGHANPKILKQQILKSFYQNKEVSPGSKKSVPTMAWTVEADEMDAQLANFIYKILNIHGKKSMSDDEMQKSIFNITKNFKHAMYQAYFRSEDHDYEFKNFISTNVWILNFMMRAINQVYLKHLAQGQSTTEVQRIKNDGNLAKLRQKFLELDARRKEPGYNYKANLIKLFIESGTSTISDIASAFSGSLTEIGTKDHFANTN